MYQPIVSNKTTYLSTSYIIQNNVFINLLYKKFSLMVKFGPMVFYLFGHVVKCSVLEFFIYSVLWIWSSNPDRNLLNTLTATHTMYVTDKVLRL